MNQFVVSKSSKAARVLPNVWNGAHAQLPSIKTTSQNKTTTVDYHHHMNEYFTKLISQWKTHQIEQSKTAHLLDIHETQAPTLGGSKFHECRQADKLQACVEGVEEQATRA